MGTQLIFTVGTNPLPIWVAWQHLKDRLRPPIQVRFVHTAGTTAETQRLGTNCQGATFLNHIQTSEGNPRTVRNDIRRIVNDLADDDTEVLHVHYTGGTKVMGVETVAALETSLPEGIRLDTSYLDPRASSGPAIVDRTGEKWNDDARQGIDPDLDLIAKLNGFELGPFDHQYWARGRLETIQCPASTEELTQEKLDLGMQALGRGRCNNSIHLEYGAYAAFQEALTQISNQSNQRSNYRLFHSVHVRRADAEDQRVRPFELDVVAVLGYQIVVVSCTTVPDHSTVKQKAMEAYHRARQLGGDEARAIVLCSMDRQNRELIEKELEDEMGSSSLPLRIWGSDLWNDLSRRFGLYLRGALHWR